MDMKLKVHGTSCLPVCDEDCISVMASGMKIFISFIVLWGEDLNFNHDILLEARVFNGGSVAFDRTWKGKCKTSPDTQL